MKPATKKKFLCRLVTKLRKSKTEAEKLEIFSKYMAKNLQQDEIDRLIAMDLLTPTMLEQL
jgi:hypothetical protein